MTASPGRRHLRANNETPLREGAPLGFDDRCRASMKGSEAISGQYVDGDHPPRAGDVRDIEVEPHPQSMNVPAGAQPQRALDAVSAEEPATAAPGRVGDLDRRNISSVHHEAHGAMVTRRRHLERGQGSLEVTGVLAIAAVLVAAIVVATSGQSSRMSNAIVSTICEIVTLGQGNCGDADTEARMPTDYLPSEPCVVSGTGSSTSGQVGITFVKISASEGWLIEELGDGTYRLTRVDDLGVGGTAGLGFGATVTIDGDRVGIEAQVGGSASLIGQNGEVYVAGSLEEAQEILAQKSTDDTKDFWLGDDNPLRSGWDWAFGEGEHEQREPDEWFEAAGENYEGSANATLLNGDAGAQGQVEALLGTRYRSDGTSTEYFEASMEGELNAGVMVAGAGLTGSMGALIEVDRDADGNPTAMRIVSTTMGDAYAYDDPSERENPEVTRTTIEIPLDTQEGRDLAARTMWASGLPLNGVFPDVDSNAIAIPGLDAQAVGEELGAFARDHGKMWRETYTEDVSTNGFNITGKLGGELGGGAEWSDTTITTTGAEYYDGTGWVERPGCAA